MTTSPTLRKDGKILRLFLHRGASLVGEGAVFFPESLSSPPLVSDEADLTVLPPVLTEVLAESSGKAVLAYREIGWEDRTIRFYGVEARQPLPFADQLALLSLVDGVILWVSPADFAQQEVHRVTTLAARLGVPHLVLLLDAKRGGPSWQERTSGVSLNPETSMASFASDLGFARIDRVMVSPGELPWKGLSAHLSKLETKSHHAPPSSQSPKGPPSPDMADQFAVHVFWLGEKDALPGRRYGLRLGDQEARASLSALKHLVDPVTHSPLAGRTISAGQIAYGNLEVDRPLAFAPYDQAPAQGAFLLRDPITGRPTAYGHIRFALRRATNVRWQALKVDRGARAALNGQKPFVLWFTGLSGSGKSTLASLLDKALHEAGYHTYVLDGDNVRHGLCRDLGFTEADRVENMRRIRETAKLMLDAGLIVLVAFISPFRSERRAARALFEDGEFVEIFVDTPLAECERRDPKGLYKKARAGEITNFTGIDSPYEPPENPDIHLPGATLSPEAMVERIWGELARRGFLSRSRGKRNSI